MIAESEKGNDLVSKVILQGYMQVADADMGAVQAELLLHIELTLKEPGCLVFHVERDPVDRNRFNVYEEFTDPEAFGNHQERVKNSDWGRVTGNVQRHYSIQGL